MMFAIYIHDEIRDASIEWDSIPALSHDQLAALAGALGCTPERIGRLAQPFSQRYGDVVMFPAGTIVGYDGYEVYVLQMPTAL